MVGWIGLTRSIVSTANRYNRIKKQEQINNVIEEISSQLANDKKFKKCKNISERMLYIEMKYPDLKNEKTVIKKIASRAKAIIKISNLVK